MINYQAIIDHYYPEAEVPELRHILLVHSKAVADKAVSITDAHPEWHIDRDFVYAAAMLHDIGIIRCNAPSIYCHGTEPYIKHGVIGEALVQEFTVHSSCAPVGAQALCGSCAPVGAQAFLLPETGLLSHDKRGRYGGGNKSIETERDVKTIDKLGAQFTVDYALRIGRVCARHTGTGLPGLEPETLEEQIICYADKFFSKTKPDREKTFDEACHSLMKFGAEGVKKFEAWHKMFQ